MLHLNLLTELCNLFCSKFKCPPDDWCLWQLSSALSPSRPTTISANTHGRHFVVFGRLSRSPRQSSLSLYSIRFDLKLFDFPGPPKVFDCLLFCAPGNCREVSSASPKGWASRIVGVSPGKCRKSAKNSVIGFWESSTFFPFFPRLLFVFLSRTTLLPLLSHGFGRFLWWDGNSVCVRGGPQKREQVRARDSHRFRVSRQQQCWQILSWVILSPESDLWMKETESEEHNTQLLRAKTTTQRGTAPAAAVESNGRKKKTDYFCTTTNTERASRIKSGDCWWRFGIFSSFSV